MQPENRRSFVKKSVATTISLSSATFFSSLIRARGDEGGGTTTEVFETTFATTVVSTENFNSTVDFFETTAVTTVEETFETTPVVYNVEGSEITATGLFSVVTGVYWGKAKVVITSPNPGPAVTINVMPAGAECGAFPELVGSSVTISASRSPSGAFLPVCTEHIGFISRNTIAYLPSLPPPLTPVDVCVKITAIDILPGSITMSGQAWMEAGVLPGAVAKSSVKDWKVRIVPV